MRKINITIIESNALFRNGLHHFLHGQNNNWSILSFESIVICSNEVLLNTDILFFDGQDDYSRRQILAVKRNFPKIKLIIFSNDVNLLDNYTFAQKHTIGPVLDKEIEPNKLLELLYRTIKRINLDIRDLEEPAIIKPKGNKKTSSFFSLRELSILNLISQGKTNREISVELEISHRTIEVHRRRMIERLGCANIIPVILYAIESREIKINIGKKFNLMGE